MSQCSLTSSVSWKMGIFTVFIYILLSLPRDPHIDLRMKYLGMHSMVYR